MTLCTPNLSNAFTPEIFERNHKLFNLIKIVLKLWQNLFVHSICID